jgi:hypothetical protein
MPILGEPFCKKFFFSRISRFWSVSRPQINLLFFPKTEKNMPILGEPFCKKFFFSCLTAFQGVMRLYNFLVTTWNIYYTHTSKLPISPSQARCLNMGDLPLWNFYTRKIYYTHRSKPPISPSQARCPNMCDLRL